MTVTAGALRELHRIHQQLADLRERQQRGPQQVQAHQANVSRLEAEKEQLHQDVKRSRMNADEKQLQLKSGEAKIADLKRKLNTSGSNREYQALLEQIAADEMANSVLEDEILEALGRIDELVAESAAADAHLAKAQEDLAKLRHNVTSQAELIQGDITRLEADLITAETILPSEFRDAYKRVTKSKGSDGMAQLEGECCSGCFQQVPPNKISQLHMQQAVFCTSCGRLLYLVVEG